MTTAFAFAATAFLSLCLQDKEYHEFDYWSAFKTGSTVTLKMEMEGGCAKVAVQMTKTLLEVAPDKVVIEHKSKIIVNGMEQPESTQKEEILKDKDKTPIKVEKEGDEEIEVGGKKIKCHWIEGTQSESKSKVWISKDIPGGVARGEISGGKFPGVLKVSAVSWEKK